jgi:6-pyruvoyltetrahydropterin/6-carboxytetrahydropterin synthase
VAVYRKEHFNAAHRLFNPEWDKTKNDAVFGKCNNPHYHGHNYEIVVQVVGEIDKDTGFVMNLKDLSDIIKEYVLEKFDHMNLNEDLEYFKELIPTAENICLVIFRILREKIDSRYELKVRLYETERNFVEYPV